MAPLLNIYPIIDKNKHQKWWNMFVANPTVKENH